MITRIISFILLVFSFNFLIAQNNIIRGIVKLQSSGSQPIENVEISAFGSNSVYSNASGMFQMTFVGKGPGSTVSLLVNKDGYEVINDKEIERCVIRDNPDELLFIVLAKQGERNRQALSYYNIILQNSDDTYKKELSSLKGQLNSLKEDDSTRKILLEQIAALQEEKENLLKQAEQLAQQLASVDLDQASEIAKKAFDEFNKGNVTAALEILSDESLAENLRNTKEEKDRLASRLGKADKAYQQSIDNYMIKARFLISSSAFGNAMAAYKKAYEADSNNIDRILEIARFQGRINMQNSAIKLFDRALILSKSYEQKIKIFIDQALQYSQIEQYKLFQQSIEKAKELLVEWNPEENDANRFTRAEVYYTEAVLFMQLNENEKALRILESLLEKYEDFADKGIEFQLLIYAAQINMATIYFLKLGDFEKSEKMLDIVIPNYQNLYDLDAKEYSFHLADAYSTQGGMYAYARKFKEAESSFTKAAELFRVNIDDNPFLSKERIAKSHTNLGSVLAQQGKFDQAIEQHNKSMNLFQELSQDNPIRYQLSLSKSLNNIGYVYNGQGKYREAIEHYKNAIAIREDLATINPQRFNYDLCDSYLSTSGVLENALKNTLDMKYRDEALEILNKAAEVWESGDTTTRKAKVINKWINHFYDIFQSFDEKELEIQRYINKADLAYSNISSQEELTLLQEKFKTMIDTLSYAIKIHRDNQRLLDKQSFMYAELAWVLINHNEYLEAENIIREGMVINPSNNSLKSYLPTALLLQGKREEAEKIYLEMKDMMDGRQPFKVTFLNDLASLEASGITHPDIEFIRNLLNE